MQIVIYKPKEKGAKQHWNGRKFNCSNVFDNVTLTKEFEPPKELYKANGKPFDFNGITYSPKYVQGQIKRYEGQINNIRLFLYPNKIYLSNSIHKYWRGNNYSNFYLCEMIKAIQMLNEDTGINWNEAIVKKCEYGCNVEVNAKTVINSLVSYKSKDYLAMQRNGKKYGAVCEFTDYKIKGYDKAFEVKSVSGASLNYPLLRWEISLNRMRHIEKHLCLEPLRTKHLLRPETWQIMAKDAILKYQNTIKMQSLHLYKLSTHEKRIIAEMLIPAIRDDLKIHNKETYKRDQRIYRRIMRDKSICIDDDMTDLLSQKFKVLLNNQQI